MKSLLVTGSSGLVGSEVCRYFAARGWTVHGCDNNSRRAFFGPDGDTRWNRECLKKEVPSFLHHELDIRDREAIPILVQAINPSAIVHAAAQPSHDYAAKVPYDDFDINACGTLNLLESTRRYAPEAVFIFLSTNKVYGDRPNQIPLRELPLRWDYERLEDYDGIDESMSVDQSVHSLFGVSKLSADVMVQEYGRYFAMQTCCLRGGCLTGPNHAGVEQHGFLNHLIRCNLSGAAYRVYGYGGKQVRDNIHAIDVAAFIHAYVEEPRRAEVYNLGGGRQNSCSILEAIQQIEALSGKRMNYELQANPRVGDHICYISNLTKARTHYPHWRITQSLNNIFEQTYIAWKNRIDEIGQLSYPLQSAYRR